MDCEPGTPGAWKSFDSVRRLATSGSRHSVRVGVALGLTRTVGAAHGTGAGHSPTRHAVE
jgi:hypothetical protein